MDAKDRLIVALDVEDIVAARNIVAELKPYVTTYKIGLRLFTRFGPESIETVMSCGCKVFLDLKLHDIPSIVGKTARTITGFGIEMFTVHALGGYEMMRAAKDGASCSSEGSAERGPLVLAVTILTHLEGRVLKNELGINRSLDGEVKQLASLGVKAGLDGLVCSPKEISALRKKCGDKIKIVTPGIRPLWAESGDQRRTLSPSEAIRAGADYIVVGRPILEARRRAEAVEKILDEMDGS